VQLIRESRLTRAAQWGAVALLIAVFASPAYSQAVPKAGYLSEGSFQLPGKGQPGGPDRPRAIAVAADGSLHIVDERGLVLVFDSAGAYQRSYGQGTLDRPTAIGVSRQGEAYVLDSGRKQVAVYGPDGGLLRTIAGRGGRGGALSDPVDMAIGPGFVYVLDLGRAGVQIFSVDGLFVRDINVGDFLRDPASLCVANDGTIYLTDRQTPTLVYAVPPFTQLPWVGSLPRGIAGRVSFRGAQFQNPVAMSANNLGTVVVLDQESGRLWGKNPTTTVEIGSTDVIYGGSGTGRGSFRRAVDVAFAGDTDVLILDGESRKVERIRLATEDGFQRRPDLDFPIRVSNVPRSLPAPLLDVGYGADGQPIFLLEIENHAVSLLGTQEELHQTVFGDSVPVYMPNPEVLQRQFAQELGEVAEATLSGDRVVIADPGRDRFAIFSLTGGGRLGTFGDNYRDDRRLNDPRGLAVLPDGRIVIADTGNDRVKIFSADLASLVSSFPFVRPTGVAVSPSGEIYVWDATGMQVAHLLLRDSKFEGLDTALVPRPVASLTFDRAGNLFVLGRTTHRVTVVADDLSRVLIQLGAEGALNRPERVRVDQAGNIYVADAGAGLTKIYRWEVDFPPVTGLELKYEGETAVLSWGAGPPRYTRGYEIQGADAFGGPYRVLLRTETPSYRVDPANRPTAPPRYLRVAPIFITGGHGRPTAPVPLAYFASSAAYQRGDYQEALQLAREGLQMMDEGRLSADADSRSRLLYQAFVSAYALRDYELAGEYARPLVELPQPRERLIPFLFRLANLHLMAGNARQASQAILTLVGQGPRPEYYRDSAVVAQSFQIHRNLRRAGYAADALEFLRLYTQSMPATITEVIEAYEDSITVIATRDALAPGFEFWSNADYSQVVAFFENVLATGGLSVEQIVVARQVLAAAYFAYGRRAEAEDTFREIFNLRPQFDLTREVPRIRRLYGLTLYNPETERFFGAIRPRT
jgi:tetratricopeptide (TPR) repeat protein